MKNELKGIIKEEVKEVVKEAIKETSEYAQGVRDGVLLVAKTYDIELSETFKEELEVLVKIMSSK